MASRQEQASYHAGETKARAEEKTGAAQEKGREAKYKASDAADRAMGRGQDAKEATRDKARDAADRTMGMGRDAKEATRDKAYRAKDAASGAAEATRDKAYEAKDAASETAGAAGDRARDGAQQAGGYISQTAEVFLSNLRVCCTISLNVALDDAHELILAEVARQKAAGAAQYAKETVVAGKDKTGALLQQAGETVVNTTVAAKDKVVNTAVGAKDAVMNSLGMAGENNDGATNAGKDTSTYKPGTGRDY